MKKITKFFEWIDRFSVPISFRYKKDDSFSTCLGGVVSLIFILFTIGFGIYYFIPFCKRKNYSLYYYTINLNQTEEINLYKSKSSIAFELECSANNDEIKKKYENISKDDLFEFNVRYIFYEDNGTDIIKNSTTRKSFGECTDTHFYNNLDLIKPFSEDKLRNLTCIDNLDEVIKNRHQDRLTDNFTYFQIDIKAKDVNNISFIQKYLQDFDCKVELYYTDVKIEVDDYSDPVKPFLNEVFLQLNPNMISKMNAFFMNEYFESVHDLFFPTEGIDKINNLFSRTEQYFIYTDPNDNETDLAKIYIRADTRKMEIKRKYQTVLEFFADTFSFWGDIFIICQIIFTAYNKAALDYYIEEEVFYFKGMKNKYFNIDKKSEKYKKLKTMMIKYKLIKNNESIKKLFKENTNKNKHDDVNYTSKETEDNFIKKNDNINLNIKDFIINIKPDINNNKNNNNNDKNNDKNNNNKKMCKYFKYIWNQTKFAFISFIDFFRCKKCKCGCIFTESNKLLLKAENIINDKLDIISYIKNMIILDIFHYDINSNWKDIYKLLSMPVIAPDDTDDEEISETIIFDNKIRNQYLTNDDIDDLPYIYEHWLKVGDSRVIEFVKNKLIAIYENI